MPAFKQYSDSPLHMGIVRLLANLETIKQNPNYAVGMNQQERASIYYLNNLHETVNTLHDKILPLFSEGNYPGWFDMYKLIKLKGLASQLKKATKPTLDVMLDYEIARSLMIFIESLPDESLSAIAPFLNVNKIPDIGKAYMNKFFGMECFSSNTALQTDLRLKKQTLQLHIAAFEEGLGKSTSIARTPQDSNLHDLFQAVRPSTATANSMFLTKKPSMDMALDLMNKETEPHSPHSPTVG